MKPRGRLIRRVAPILGVAVALLLIPGAAGGAASLPTSIASTGDSITRAYNTGFFPFSDNPAGSWSTGTSLNSHYVRLRTLNPAITGRVNNDARTGATMSELAGQLSTAATQRAAYVTILMGANDVCRPSVAAMTPVATFRSQFQAALTSFTANDPTARIFVASIPNIYNLWAVEHTNPSAVFIWSRAAICQSMLANATSNAPADAARRAQVQQRNLDFNAQLRQVCALFPACRFDNNAVYNTVFATSDVNSRDYFHPSPSGQAKLAAIAWSASFWGP